MIDFYKIIKEMNFLRSSKSIRYQRKMSFLNDSWSNVSVISNKTYDTATNLINTETYNKTLKDIVIMSNKTYDTIGTTGALITNEACNKTLDKLVETAMQLEERARLNQLKDFDINVSINVGLINIGISKRIGNE